MEQSKYLGTNLNKLKRKKKNEMGKACGTYAKHKCIQDFGGDT